MPVVRDGGTWTELNNELGNVISLPPISRKLVSKFAESVIRLDQVRILLYATNFINKIILYL
jgi:hypothetical protein